MKKNYASMQEILDQYKTLKKTQKATATHTKKDQSRARHQPTGMEKWLEMFPPTHHGKQEEVYDPSRHQKVNNLKAERELDLHGMTWLEAQQALNYFLHRAQCDGVIAVRIIHGKGNRSQIEGGVLKPRVITYLQQDKRVKKVHQAGYRDGQSGACLVIIKMTTA